jgi:hypothetical protein
MYRAFEELGVTLGGVSFGSFTGKAQFDEAGDPVIIDIEASAGGPDDLRLDIAELVQERISFRRKFGSGFLDHRSQEIHEHAKRWMLFQALSESLIEQYRDDIIDYRADLKDARGAA